MFEFFFSECEDALRHGRELFLLVRGIEGSSCAPLTWGRFYRQLPQLSVRVALATRNNYLEQRDIWFLNNPRPLHNRFSLLPAANMYYTEPMAARNLDACERGMIHDLPARKIIKWQQKAYDARSGGPLTVGQARLVLTRGRGRNAVHWPLGLANPS